MAACDRHAGTLPLDGRARQAQAAWCRWLCRLYGIHLETRGEPPASPPLMFVSNHVSWLDIIVLSALQPVVFLSKSEVADWPLIGPVATGLGTLYIQRGRKAAAERATSTMVQALRQGRRVLFFPEGTTSTGLDVLPFRPRLFQAAIDAGAPVQPIAIRYCLPDGGHAPAVPFVAAQSLSRNVWALAAIPRLRATVHAAPPIKATGASRSEISGLARGAISRHIRQPMEAVEG